jgi:hypothetical protein
MSDSHTEMQNTHKRSDITDRDNSNNKLMIPQSDGWDSVPPTPERFIKGRMLKFRDGAYFHNRNEPILADELQLVVIGVIVVWERWEDGEKVEQRITKPRQRHPKREELSHFDKSKWPEAKFGDEPSDPWHDTRYVHLLDPKTAEEYTFVTDTFGGRIAVGDLANQIAGVRCAHPGAIPLVSLGSEMMQTRSGQSRPKPYFKALEWRPGKDGGSAPPRADAALPIPEPAALDDEIPF